MTESSPTAAATASAKNRRTNAALARPSPARARRATTWKPTIAAQTSSSRPILSSDARQAEAHPAVVEEEHRRTDPREADAIPSVDDGSKMPSLRAPQVRRTCAHFVVDELEE